MHTKKKKTMQAHMHLFVVKNIAIPTDGLQDRLEDSPAPVSIVQRQTLIPRQVGGVSGHKLDVRLGEPLELPQQLVLDDGDGLLQIGPRGAGDLSGEEAVTVEGVLVVALGDQASGGEKLASLVGRGEGAENIPDHFGLEVLEGAEDGGGGV